MKKGSAFPSRFWNVEDLRGKSDLVVTIRHLEEKENVGMEDDPKHRPVLYFEGYEKGLALGPDAWDSVVDAVGGKDDSDEWPGCRVALYVDPKVKFGGKAVGGVRARKPGGGAAATSGGQPLVLAPNVVAKVKIRATEAGLTVAQIGQWLAANSLEEIPIPSDAATWPASTINDIAKAIEACKGGWKPAPVPDEHEAITDDSVPF